MKKTLRLLFPLAMAAILAAGCTHLDLGPDSGPNRVLTGTIGFNDPVSLPDNAVVVVRVMDAMSQDLPPPPPNPQDQTLKRPVPPPNMPPQELGEQEIKHPGAAPIAYHVEYTADDGQLRRGLNVEARVSIGGKVRYINLNHYAIGFTNYTEPLTIWLSALQ